MPEKQKQQLINNHPSNYISIIGIHKAVLCTPENMVVNGQFTSFPYVMASNFNSLLNHKINAIFFVFFFYIKRESIRNAHLYGKQIITFENIYCYKFNFFLFSFQNICQQ